MKVIAACLLILSVIITASAQNKSLPSIRAKGNTLTIYINGERDSFNGVSALPNLFNYSLGVEKETTPFVLVSEQDSIVMTLQYGVITQFRIVREAKGDTVLCHFTSHKDVKAAVFSDAYKKVNEGKTLVEVPEVYELVNVVFALTNYGETPAIHKKTEYYQAVMTHFSPYRNHPAVRAIDTLLTRSGDDYFNLKMDSYAYRFDGNNIRKGDVYDRVSWGQFNTLTPYVALLQSFANQSGFRRFYRKYLPYYNGLVNDFQKNVDVATMKRWLEKQFPTTHYSTVKVIFSPLVGWNQSANNFSDNGFTEAQAHINFPFIDA